MVEHRYNDDDREKIRRSAHNLYESTRFKEQISTGLVDPAFLLAENLAYTMASRKVAMMHKWRKEGSGPFGTAEELDTYKEIERLNHEDVLKIISDYLENIG